MYNFNVYDLIMLTNSETFNSVVVAGDYSRHLGLTPQATSRKRALNAGVDWNRHILHASEIDYILHANGLTETTHVVYFQKINWRQKT